jgi:hypothetical protein
VEGARPKLHMIMAPETAQGLPIGGHPSSVQHRRVTIAFP